MIFSPRLPTRTRCSMFRHHRIWNRRLAQEDQEPSASGQVWLVMHRYNFDLVDTENATGVTGALLDDDDQAMRVGLELAQEVRQVRPELIGQGCEILIRREDGGEVWRVSIDEPPKRKNGS